MARDFENTSDPALLHAFHGFTPAQVLAGEFKCTVYIWMAMEDGTVSVNGGNRPEGVGTILNNAANPMLRDANTGTAFRWNSDECNALDVRMAIIKHHTSPRAASMTECCVAKRWADKEWGTERLNKEYDVGLQKLEYRPCDIKAIEVRQAQLLKLREKDPLATLPPVTWSAGVTVIATHGGIERDSKSLATAALMGSASAPVRVLIMGRPGDRITSRKARRSPASLATKKARKDADTSVFGLRARAAVFAQTASPTHASTP